jgi:hypothetical protein
MILAIFDGYVNSAARSLNLGRGLRVQRAGAARTSEAEKWRHFTVSTVFEDGLFDSRLYMANSGIDS